METDSITLGKNGLFMDFSESGIQKKIEKSTSETARWSGRMQVNAYYIVAILIAGTLLIAGFAVAGMVRGMIGTVPDVAKIDLLAVGEPSSLYDAGGSLTQQVKSMDPQEQCVSSRKLTRKTRLAFVAAMDPEFYEHHGMNLNGLKNIGQQILFSVTSDTDSHRTITQQLLVNQLPQLYCGGRLVDRLTEQIQEQYLAMELEEYMTKEEILTCYLNTLSMGINVHGIKDAADYYLEKKPENLSLGEAAVLAAVAEDPENYNPFDAPVASKQEQQRILKIMLDRNMITEEEYENALGEDIYGTLANVRSGQAARSQDVSTSYADSVVSQVIEDLQTELGYSNTQAYNAVYHGGLTIETCQDEELQKICNQVANDDSLYPADSGYYLSYQLVIRTASGSRVVYSEKDLAQYFRTQDAPAPQKKTVTVRRRIVKKIRRGKRKIRKVVYKKVKKTRYISSAASGFYSKTFSLYFASKQEGRKAAAEFLRNIQREDDEILRCDVQLVRQPQASVVVMDQQSGRIKAVIGGRSGAELQMDKNRAAKIYKQPGTALSVLSAYVPALDTAGMSLGSVVDDARSLIPGTTQEVPESKSYQYKGLITIREAIRDSSAVASVKVMEQVNPQTSYEYLRNMGLSTLVESQTNTQGERESDVDYSIALGSLLKGVTNQEMTAAYASLANRGVYQNPVYYTRVLDAQGNVLLRKKSVSNRIMKQSTAYLVTHALEDSFSKKEVRRDGIARAGKTGATDDESDSWFLGYTPYYTVGVWSGYDGTRHFQDVSEGTKYCRLIWSQIMNRIHKKEKLGEAEFARPAHLVESKICTKCGKLAVDGVCDQIRSDGKDFVRTELFTLQTRPDTYCDCHVKYTVCKASGRLATEQCPKDQTVEKVYLVKDVRDNTLDNKMLLPEGFQEKYCEIHGE